MKKTILGLSLFISSFAFAQNGLEKIIVEKYYISNAADAAKADLESTPPGTLPSGSITYRVYADMLPGFKLVQIYADQPAGHKLIFRTTTSFYNNPNGDYTPSFTKANLKNSLLALDSYLTMGTAAKDGQYGILKADDNGVSNIVDAGNADGVLLNNTTEMGVPLTTNDGIISGTGTINSPSIAGIDVALEAFGNGSVVSDSLVAIDGSLYTTGNAVGPVPQDNRVLIAQVTTNGKLSFELNLLVVGTGPNDVGQFYVANNPTLDPNGNQELTIPSLTYPDLITNVITPSYKDYNEVLFSVYPNPVQANVTVELTTAQANSKGSYTIYGVVGNVIAHKELNGITGNYKETIDMSSFAKGLYTIQMNVNGVSSTKKIIKN